MVNEINKIYFKLLNEVLNSNDIVKNYNFNTPFFSKYPSIIIFLVYALKKDKDNIEIYDKLILNIKLMIYEINKIKKINSSLCYGIISVGYSLNFAKDYLNDNKLLKDLNYLILKITYLKLQKCKLNLKKSQICESDYDLIQGISSNLVYLLKYNFKGNDVIIRDISNYFNKILQKINKKYIFKNNNINWYVSHGIISVIYANALCAKNKINYKTNKLQFIKIMRYIKMNKCNDIENISWCYGELSFNFLLYKCIEIYDLKNYKNVICNKIQKIICNEKLFNLDSPTFCHGYAGILNIINNLKIKDKNLIKIKKHCINKILSYYNLNYPLCFKNYDKILIDQKYSKDKYLIDDIGILSGSIGVVLSLMDCVHEKEINWSEMFLI